MTVPRATSPRTSLSRRMMRGTSAAGPLIASSFPRTWKSTAGNWFSMNLKASSWLPSDWTICSESSNKTTSVRSPGREWGNSPAVRSPALNRALPFAASVMVLARGPLVPSSMNMVCRRDPCRRRFAPSAAGVNGSFHLTPARRARRRSGSGVAVTGSCFRRRPTRPASGRRFLGTAVPRSQASERPAGPAARAQPSSRARLPIRPPASRRPQAARIHAALMPRSPARPPGTRTPT